MRPRLFLCGPIGCGKSTLIKNALGPSAGAAGGFVTLRAKAGETLLGFDLLPARALARPERMGEARRFLSFEAGRPQRDDGVFRTQAARLLREAREAPFAVLDELGGFELLIPEFSAALRDFLASGVPCVGVLKSLPAGDELRRRLALTENYLQAAEALRRRLAEDSGTLLLETGGRYDKRAENALREWVSEYVGSI